MDAVGYALANSLDFIYQPPQLINKGTTDARCGCAVGSYGYAMRSAQVHKFNADEGVWTLDATYSGAETFTFGSGFGVGADAYFLEGNQLLRYNTVSKQFEFRNLSVVFPSLPASASDGMRYAYLGGPDDLYRLDTVSGALDVVAGQPSGYGTAVTAVYKNGLVYIVYTSNAMLVYDTSAGEWLTLGPTPNVYSGSKLFFANDRLFLSHASDATPSQGTQSAVFEYILRSALWVETGRTVHLHKYGFAITIDGHAYIGGASYGNVREFVPGQYTINGYDALLGWLATR